MDPNAENGPSSGFLSCPSLPDVEQYFDVKVCCALNPSNFFVQPYEAQDRLRILMINLQEKYKDVVGNDPLEMSDIIPRKSYAAKHEGLWYRTSVVKVNHPGSISVFYCDFGYFANLSLEQLLPLAPEFRELPHQAIRAKLAGLQPRNGTWSTDDEKFFEKLVCGRVFVSILKAKEHCSLAGCNTLLQLQLINTETCRDIDIHQVLIEKGIALLVQH